MPMAMLRGSGEDLKGELLGMGLKFDVRDNKKSLIEYINNQTPNKTRTLSTPLPCLYSYLLNYRRKYGNHRLLDASALTAHP
jgi:hypothetical protein